MNTVDNDEYTIEIPDPLHGNYVIVTAKLYEDGIYYNYEDETGYWSDIDMDPEFCCYTYEDMTSGTIGILPDGWRPMVDLILCNLYWDRELNR